MCDMDPLLLTEIMAWIGNHNHTGTTYLSPNRNATLADFF